MFEIFQLRTSKAIFIHTAMLHHQIINDSTYSEISILHYRNHCSETYRDKLCFRYTNGIRISLDCVQSMLFT